jgi:predicted nucleic acid-binding protein
VGALTLPKAGLVYVDTSPVIYSVEKVAPYAAVVDPLWDAMELGAIQVATSELTLLEALVVPFKQNDVYLIAAFENILTDTALSLISIDLAILRSAARLRAITNLKTPDSIHAATALDAGCNLFITNDAAFRRVPGLNVTVLSQLP